MLSGQVRGTCASRMIFGRISGWVGSALRVGSSPTTENGDEPSWGHKWRSRLQIVESRHRVLMQVARTRGPLRTCCIKT